MLTKIHALFISSVFVSKYQAEIGKKIEQKLNNTVRLLELLLLENYAVSSSTLSSKDNRRYSKKCAKNKYVYLNENIRLMAKKMRLKMKNRSSRYDINRTRRRHGHKFTKYKICLHTMMVMSIRQDLRYI